MTEHIEEIPAEEHCYHHMCSRDNDACEAGDCDDEDDCIHCECCCTCLGCEYGPRDGMLLFDPTADEPFTPARTTPEATDG